MSTTAELQLIAERIRELRGIMNLSVAQMAEITGVSQREYIESENGYRDMSFTFLHKCAQAFKTDISALVTGELPKLSKYTLMRSGEGMPIRRKEGFEYQHMAPLFKDRLVEPFMVTAKYSEKLENSPVECTQHDGEEFDYIIDGRLKVVVDGHVEFMDPGDKMLLNSALPHGMVAVGGEDCHFMSIVVKGSNTAFDYSHDDSGTLADGDDNDLLYKRFVNETVNEHGLLTDISFNVPENFNFAFDVVDALAAKDPDKTAMVWLSNKKEKRVFTFKDISVLSSKAANYLSSLGIRKNDKVMLVLKRHWQFWVAINALHKIGAVVIPATNQLTEKDYAYRFNAARVKAVIATTDGEVIDFINAACLESDTVKLRLSVNGVRDGWLDFDKGIEDQSDYFPRPEDHNVRDSMLMYFTSGTTGYPKIATHSYAYAIGHIVTARFWHNVDPNGLHFTISDTGWGKAVWGKLYGAWLCEAAVFTYDFDRFHANDILPLFAEYNITTFCAPPTMYRFFIKEDLTKYDFSSVRDATTAGEALNEEVYEQFRNATGLCIREGFGQTETTLTVANLVGGDIKPGSMGKPTPQFDIRLINTAGEETKVGEVGEICLNTHNKVPYGMFVGYYLDDEKTVEAWHDDMYHTGDMAWRDEDGYFWYFGRTDDLIKSSGYRIGPFEIESVLMELPYVLECAITGVPDPTRGQVVKATIVLTRGTVGSDELKKEIQNYVKEHTAPYKYPRVVEFVDALPKTISGKIRRNVIRDQEK